MKKILMLLLLILFATPSSYAGNKCYNLKGIVPEIDSSNINVCKNSDTGSCQFINEDAAGTQEIFEMPCSKFDKFEKIVREKRPSLYQNTENNKK